MVLIYDLFEINFGMELVKKHGDYENFYVDFYAFSV